MVFHGNGSLRLLSWIFESLIEEALVSNDRCKCCNLKWISGENDFKQDQFINFCLYLWYWILDSRKWEIKLGGNHLTCCYLHHINPIEQTFQRGLKCSDYVIRCLERISWVEELMHLYMGVLAWNDSVTLVKSLLSIDKDLIQQEWLCFSEFFF